MANLRLIKSTPVLKKGFSISDEDYDKLLKENELPGTIDRTSAYLGRYCLDQIETRKVALEAAKTAFLSALDRDRDRRNGSTEVATPQQVKESLKKSKAKAPTPKEVKEILKKVKAKVPSFSFENIIKDAIYYNLQGKKVEINQSFNTKFSTSPSIDLINDKYADLKQITEEKYSTIKRISNLNPEEIKNLDAAKELDLANLEYERALAQIAFAANQPLSDANKNTYLKELKEEKVALTADKSDVFNKSFEKNQAYLNASYLVSVFLAAKPNNIKEFDPSKFNEALEKKYFAFQEFKEAAAVEYELLQKPDFNKILLDQNNTLIRDLAQNVKSFLATQKPDINDNNYHEKMINFYQNSIYICQEQGELKSPVADAYKCAKDELENEFKHYMANEIGSKEKQIITNPFIKNKNTALAAMYKDEENLLEKGKGKALQATEEILTAIKADSTSATIDKRVASDLQEQPENETKSNWQKGAINKAADAILHSEQKASHVGGAFKNHNKAQQTAEKNRVSISKHRQETKPELPASKEKKPSGKPRKISN